VNLLLELLACAQPSADGAFADLSDLVIGHAGQLGMVVCVLLDWDGARQTFIARLRAAQLRALVLVIGDGGAAGEIEPGPMSDARSDLLRITPASVAAQLAALGTGPAVRSAA
jgi:hypothetical protein